ncbi:MAG: porin family protein [Paludibacter sp.]|nr:porin family protein [Paludibacter sp.]
MKTKIFMKTNVIMLTAILMLASNNKTYAQNDQIHVGVKAGVNYSNVYDSEGEEYTADGKFGFAGGAFVSIPVTPLLGIQPELLFSQKGFQATGTVLGNDISFTRTSAFLDLPIFLAIKPNEMLTLLVGPQYSFLMSQKDVFANPIQDIVVQEDFDTDNIRRNTLCLVGGADVNLSNIVLGARIGCDLFNNNGDGTSTTPRYKNVWGQVSVGFRL